VTVDYLVVDSEGNRIDVSPGPDWGPAVLLVEPVTDALKEVVGGKIIGQIDRAQVLAVVGFGLSDEIVDLLSTIPNRSRDIHRAVLQLGYQWEAIPLP